MKMCQATWFYFKFANIITKLMTFVNLKHFLFHDIISGSLLLLPFSDQSQFQMEDSMYALCWEIHRPYLNIFVSLELNLLSIDLECASLSTDHFTAILTCTSYTRTSGLCYQRFSNRG
jgi:hypothetical protein